MYSLSKVLEIMVYNGMLKHVEGSLTNHQFGFSQTDIPYNNFTYEILQAKTEVDVVYMDSSKTFNSHLIMAFLGDQFFLVVSPATYGAG